MMTLLTAIVLMAVLGLVLGIVIGWFAKLFRVESDARVELVTELLPGANCGGCGKAGCSDFAKSVVAGENPPSNVKTSLELLFILQDSSQARSVRSSSALQRSEDSRSGSRSPERPQRPAAAGHRS